MFFEEFRQCGAKPAPLTHVPITFRCPDGHKLSVPETLAGRKALSEMPAEDVHPPG